MVSRIPILHTCNVVVVLKQRLASFQHLRCFFRCEHLLDTEVSILNSFLYPKVPRVNVFVSFVVLLPIGPSQNSPKSCHFVFQPSLEFPDPGIQNSGLIQLDLLSPLRKTPPLQRSKAVKL